MPQTIQCAVSEEFFEVSDREIEIRKNLGAAMPLKKPKYLFQELMAFWQHFAIHKRSCDATGKAIISVFDKHCPYPVWHKEYWFKNANPPSADFNFHKGFFEQMWELFQNCPIAHNMGTNNENSEYTDDCWYSKNCYLSHSVYQCEDTYYSYRVIGLKDCQFCVYSFDSELCIDLIYTKNAYNSSYALHCTNIRDSAFLFDCVNCSDCLFSWNLKNKQYCIANKQYTKEAYLKEKEKFDLSSRKNYELIKKRFHETIKTQAWWKADFNENTENVSGAYVLNSKNSENVFFAEYVEDSVNVARTYKVKNVVDSVSPVIDSERIYYSILPQDRCYEIRFCYNVSNAKNLQYCMNCLNCEDCFACCGLVGKKYCILNKQYSKEEYETLLEQILHYTQQIGEYGKFFPTYFSPTSYDESLAGFFFPLSLEEQATWGFRQKTLEEKPAGSFSSISEIPDLSKDADESICQKVFWDKLAQKPFQIQSFDIAFCKKKNIPLHNSFYIRRIKENYAQIAFSGELRETTCAKTGKQIFTPLPVGLDGRILSEEAYLAEVY